MAECVAKLPYPARIKRRSVGKQEKLEWFCLAEWVIYISYTAGENDG